MKIHQEVLENTNSLKPGGCTGPDGIRITWRCPYLKCEHKPTVLHATLGVTAGEFPYLNHMRNTKFHMHKRLKKASPTTNTFLSL